jgi:hypothetical protein
VIAQKAFINQRDFLYLNVILTTVTSVIALFNNKGYGDVSDIVENMGCNKIKNVTLDRENFIGTRLDYCVYCEKGKDLLYGKSGNATVYGYFENDQLVRNSDYDVSIEYFFEDHLVGNIGNNVLYDEGDIEMLFGGEGDVIM